MASEGDDDEIQVNNQTWYKLQVVATKAGYRDGIADGRNSNFQSSFDEGFSQGFKNGFVLGVCKGISSSTDKNLINPILQKVVRGNCVICKNKELENSILTELTDVQTKDTNNILEELNIKYSFSSNKLKYL